MTAEQLAAMEAARSRQNRPAAATRDAAPEKPGPTIAQLSPESARKWMSIMADMLIALGTAIAEELKTGKPSELGAPGKPGSAAGASTPAEASSRNAPDRLSSFGAPSGRTTGIGDAAVRALSIWERLLPSRRHPMVADYLAEGKSARERR